MPIIDNNVTLYAKKPPCIRMNLAPLNSIEQNFPQLPLILNNTKIATPRSAF